MTVQYHDLETWTGTLLDLETWGTGAGAPVIFALGSVSLALQGQLGIPAGSVTAFVVDAEFSIDDRLQVGLQGELGISGGIGFGFTDVASPFALGAVTMALQGQVGMSGVVTPLTPVDFPLGSISMALQGQLGISTGVAFRGAVTLSTGTPTRFRRNGRR
jgi:hypothetical protein